jgi:catechol 2,3-dioxygenase-like lactoylglutathione lyase family enzyme
MKRAPFLTVSYLLPALLFCALCVPLFLPSASSPSPRAQEEPIRSRIYGIGSVRLRVTNLEKAKHFYVEILQLKELPNKCFTTAAVCLWINDKQKLELIPTSSPNDKGGLDLVGFVTLDLNKMRRYLYSRGLMPGEIMHKERPYFEISDFEDHRVAFESAVEHPDSVLSPVSSRMIHAGFVVRDRAKIDKFYKDILGFSPYWHGGMKDDETSWVAMQVPDGRDWVEYMLNVSPDADKHTLGVMNHIALGVEDIQATKERLIKNGWKPGEEPKLGRDGKWQLNLYDPDDTRVEFMEFTPKKNPCCSEFTGPHPGPKQ